MGGKRSVYMFWLGNLRRDNLEKLIVNESIILKWILKELVGMAWAGLFWFRIGRIDGPFECRNDHASGVIYLKAQI
jgi:hypothetical protein